MMHKLVKHPSASSASLNKNIIYRPRTSGIREAADRFLPALRTPGKFARRLEIWETLGTVDSSATHRLLGVPRHTRTDETNQRVGNRVDKLKVVSLQFLRCHYVRSTCQKLCSGCCRLSIGFLNSAHYTCTTVCREGGGAEQWHAINSTSRFKALELEPIQPFQLQFT